MTTFSIARSLRATVMLGASLAALQAYGDDTTPIVSYLDGLHSYAARFEQQRFDETGELLETAHGDCSIERPGRFRWNYLDPYKQVIVSDSHKLWIYDEDLAQVTVNDVNAGAPGTPAELLSAEFEVSTRYAVKHIGVKDGFDWYGLKPKDAGTQFQDVELGLADGEVKAMRLTDNLGQTTLLRFEAVKRNAPLAAGLFEFTPPVGVDVVTGGAP
ncbi:MAG: outer membrane lipoprotein chaperone LolA [Gammaproteobacteria bacterium]|nr:outer membrane lipoprotein chaperone LolA [Gammaproteobacteria bacterium]